MHPLLFMLPKIFPVLLTHQGCAAGSVPRQADFQGCSLSHPHHHEYLPILSDAQNPDLKSNHEYGFTNTFEFGAENYKKAQWADQQQPQLSSSTNVFITPINQILLLQSG